MSLSCFFDFRSKTAIFIGLETWLVYSRVYCASIKPGFILQHLHKQKQTNKNGWIAFIGDFSAVEVEIEGSLRLARAAA